MIDLEPALRSVVTILEEAGVAYVVVGSVAAAAWAPGRVTRDVDLVVQTDPHRAHAAVAALEADDEVYVPVEAARAAVGGGSFNVIHLASGGKVDVFFSTLDDSFTRSRVSRRVRATVYGVVCSVASPEDVVLAKLRWRLESRSEVQWRDCAEIAATQALDLAYMRRWAPELGVVQDLEELIDAVRRG